MFFLEGVRFVGCRRRRFRCWVGSVRRCTSRYWIGNAAHDVGDRRDEIWRSLSPLRFPTIFLF